LFDGKREKLVKFILYYNGWLDSRLIHAIEFAADDNVDLALTQLLTREYNEYLHCVENFLEILSYSELFGDDLVSHAKQEDSSYDTESNWRSRIGIELKEPKNVGLTDVEKHELKFKKLYGMVRW